MARSPEPDGLYQSRHVFGAFKPSSVNEPTAEMRILPDGLGPLPRRSVIPLKHAIDRAIRHYRRRYRQQGEV